MEHNTNLSDTINNIKEELILRDKIYESKDKLAKLSHEIQKMYARETFLNLRIDDTDLTNEEKEHIYSELNQNNKKIEELKIEYNSFEKTINDAEASMDISIDNTFKVIDGKLFIGDEMAPVKIRDDYTDILVHMTDYYPENHEIETPISAKAKTEYSLNTDEGEVEVPITRHRNTIHFVKNNIVQPIPERHVTSTKYAIIEPEHYHTNRVGSDSDTYIYGNVKLSNEAILVTDQENYEKLTDEQKNEYQLIIYNGDMIKCVDNIIKNLGINQPYYDQNNPGHAHSVYSQVEHDLELRDAIMKYIKNDNNFNESSTYEITELSQIINLVKQNQLRNNTKLDAIGINEFDNNQSYISDSDVLRTILAFGINLNGERFSFKSDDEILEYTKSIKSHDDPDCGYEQNEKLYEKTIAQSKEAYYRLLYESNKENVRSLIQNGLKSGIHLAEKLNTIKEKIEKSFDVQFSLSWSNYTLTINDLLTYNPKSNDEVAKILEAALDTLMKTKGTLESSKEYIEIDEYKHEQQDLSDGTSR